jgi:transposase
MARTGLRLGPDELEDVTKIRGMLKRAGRDRLALRLRVILLVGQGTTMEETGRVCEVAMCTVLRWVKTYRATGPWGLISRGRCEGKRPRLSADQMRELADIIDAGPEVSGIDTGVWTSPIIADLVRRQFGIKYHPSQIQRILHKLGFSIQYPKQRLSLADKALQGLWIRKELPAIKKSPERGRCVAV